MKENYNQKFNNRADLFINRRKDNKVDLPLLKSNREILKKGIFFGGGFLSLSMLFTLIIIIQSFIFKSIRSSFNQDVQSFNTLNIRIGNLKTNIKKTNESLFTLTKSLLNIRSGSLILSEITKIIPKQIILSNLNVEENTLEIKGIIQGNNKLEALNVYLLNLRNSSFIKKESVSLIKADKNINNKLNINEKKEDNLSFFIICEFVENMENINKNYIKEIASGGLVRRINILQQMGLLK